MGREAQVRGKLEERVGYEGAPFYVPVGEGAVLTDSLPNRRGCAFLQFSEEEEVKVKGSGCVFVAGTPTAHGLFDLPEQGQQTVGLQDRPDLQNTVEKIRIGLQDVLFRVGG